MQHKCLGSLCSGVPPQVKLRRQLKCAVNLHLSAHDSMDGGRSQRDFKLLEFCPPNLCAAGSEDAHGQVAIAIRHSCGPSHGSLLVPPAVNAASDMRASCSCPYPLVSCLNTDEVAVAILLAPPSLEQALRLVANAPWAARQTSRRPSL